MSESTLNDETQPLSVDERQILTTIYEYNIVDIMLWVLLLVCFFIIFCAFSSLISFNIYPGQVWYLSQPNLDLYEWYKKAFNYGD